MLTRKQQRKYLAKKDEEWQSQLHAFAETRDREALHHLRVAVKKLKAFARLSEACSCSGAVRDLNVLKKMFRQAGAIRDADNRLRLLEHFHAAPEAYRNEQRQLTEHETSAFVENMEAFRKKGKKAGRRLQVEVRSIRAGCIRDWYAKQLIKIGVLLTASGDRLHQARKRIKELLYVLSALPPQLAREIGLDTKYLDGLQDAIGQWHDAAMVVASWAGKDLAGSQAMIKECRDKEEAVRRLANDFYLHAHIR
jgi:CHAD domain-containing protein